MTIDLVAYRNEIQAGLARLGVMFERTFRVHRREDSAQACGSAATGTPLVVRISNVEELGSSAFVCYADIEIDSQTKRYIRAECIDQNGALLWAYEEIDMHLSLIERDGKVIYWWNENGLSLPWRSLFKTTIAIGRTANLAVCNLKG